MIELAAVASRFAAASADVGLLVRTADGHEAGCQPDKVFVAASTFKAVVAMDFCLRAAAGEFAWDERVLVNPSAEPLGSLPLGEFIDPVELSWRDVARLMMSVSDNVATDLLIGKLGLDRINQTAQALGLHSTVIVSDLATLANGYAQELGQPGYRKLLEAQAGRLGEAARLAASDRARIASTAAVDVARTTRTTARDMVRLLDLAWSNAAGPPEACAVFRHLMSFQKHTRLGAALGPDVRTWGKTGTLFGVATNEIGVLELQGDRFLAAAFTRAEVPYRDQQQILSAIGTAVAEAIAALKAA